MNASMKTPQGYQGIFEAANDLGDGFHLITLRAKKGKKRLKLRVKSEEVKPELIGNHVTVWAVEEVIEPT